MKKIQCLIQNGNTSQVVILEQNLEDKTEIKEGNFVTLEPVDDWLLAKTDNYGDDPKKLWKIKKIYPGRMNMQEPDCNCSKCNMGEAWL